MFAALQEIAPENVRPATIELADLLSDLGFDGATLDIELELAIDRFDMWTNPRDAAMLMSSGDYDTDEEDDAAKKNTLSE